MPFHNKTSQRLCSLCTHALTIDDTHILCDKRGVVSPDYKCLRFKYDPLRRVPKPKLKVPDLLDFKIDD